MAAKVLAEINSRLSTDQSGSRVGRDGIIERFPIRVLLRRPVYLYAAYLRVMYVQQCAVQVVRTTPIGGMFRSSMLPFVIQGHSGLIDQADLTSILRACNLACLGILTVSTPCFVVAEISSPLAVSGNVKRRKNLPETRS